MSNSICPQCKGKKQYYRRCFPVYLSGWVNCEVCKATGEIDEIKAAMIEIGKDVKAKRIELRVLVRNIAAANGFTADVWTQIERGDSTLENAYKARALVESLAYESVMKFDVVIHKSAKHKETKICATREEAEEMRDTLRELARRTNSTVLIEIKERVENELNLEVGK